MHVALLSYLFCSLFCSFVQAETLKIYAETPVYEAEDMMSRVVLFLHTGETLKVDSTEGGDYFHVRVNRGGKILSGYVQKVEVVPVEEPRTWAFGLQGTYISLNEQGKSFEDGDQVQYTTAAYKSTGFEPFLLAQLHEFDFYRLEFGYLRTNYTSTAYQNVQGAQAQPLVLQQTLLVLMLEKAWNLFGSKVFYAGLGAELAKGTAVNLTLSGSQVATTSDDLPLYVGGVVTFGAQKSLSRSLSGFVQARAAAIANQNPFILGLDASVGLLYWP